jgi:SAM-dependent methyltransferase
LATVDDEAFVRWLTAAEERYLEDLTRPELGRALRALGRTYVERRDGLANGKALEGRGKRAAFALYYAPLHFLTVRAIARNLTQPDGTRRNPTKPDGTQPNLTEPDGTRRNLTEPDGTRRNLTEPVGTRRNLTEPVGTRRNLTQPVVFDLGCGTGAAGAAWALETGARVSGSDVSAWAVTEANWTYATLGVQGRATRAGIERLSLPSSPSTLLAAFVVNELPDVTRAAALERLVAAAHDGHTVVVIEPIAKALIPWWREWERAFGALGGRSDEWRFPANLPPRLRDLDKSAGLKHRELTARSLTTFRAE